MKKSKIITKKSKAKLCVAVRLHENERDAIRDFQKREGLRNFSDALRSIIIDRSGLFNGQAQQMNS